MQPSSSCSAEQKTSDDGTLCVYADEADFTAANDVFTLLNGTAGGQESKMTKKESDLLALSSRSDRSEFTIQDLQELTGWPYINIYRALKGYDSRGKNYTGLLEKCPAISFTDRTVTVSDEDGVSIRRRTDAFAWSRELYKHWTFGGACWLDRDPDGGNDDDADGSFTALQHVCSTIAATAEKQNGAISVSGFPEYTVNNNNSVLREGNLQQNGNAYYSSRTQFAKYISVSMILNLL